MPAPKKLSEDMEDAQWDSLKGTIVIEVKAITLHQAGPVFTSTERTINAGRPGFKGIKMWRTPNCYLLELQNKKMILEIASVYSSVPV